MRQLWRRYQLWLGERRLRRSMADVREAMALLGFPLDHLSDEEISVGVIRLARATAEHHGVNVAEAAIAFAAMAHASRRT